MKKLLLITTFTISSILCGCKSIPPTEQSVSMASHGIGVAAGAVVSQLDVNMECIYNINYILTVTSTVIPQSTNETFVSVWTPVVDLELQKLLDDNKIDIYQAAIIRTGVMLAAEGIDYMFYKHSNWKQYLNLTEIAIHGFIDGYTITINCLMNSVRNYKSITMDLDTYKYINKKYKSYIKR